MQTDRRADVSADEGTYDEYLDQDDWYARSLARERQRETERERERQRQQEGVAESGEE